MAERSDAGIWFLLALVEQDRVWINHAGETVPLGEVEAAQSAMLIRWLMQRAYRLENAAHAAAAFSPQAFEWEDPIEWLRQRPLLLRLRAILTGRAVVAAGAARGAHD